MTIGRIPSVEGGIQPTIVDAKGDILTATAADTPAVLAVGNNGETLVADSSQTTGLRWGANYGFTAGKNKIINGDFNINQRAFTSVNTGGTYGFDRWRMDGAGGTVTYSAQTFTPGTAPVSGYEARNFARILPSGQSAAGDYACLIQPIEDVRTFANQTITVSFWAKAASGTPKIALEMYQEFGSGGSPSAGVSVPAGTVTISTSWARYSITVSIPSISGKTIGTTANSSSLYLILWQSAGSNFASRASSIGIQNNTFDMWGVQAETGSVATAFQTATGTLAGELAACQRYYWRWSASNGAVYSFMGTGWVYSGTIFALPVVHPVQMRVAPTSIDTSGTASHYRVLVGATQYNNTSVPSLDQANAQTSSILFTNAGTMTAGQAGGAGANNTTSAYIGFNAEL